MKKSLVSLLILASLAMVKGQQLEFMNSQNIMQNGKKLTKLEVYEIMKEDNEALKVYKNGKNLRTIGDVSFFSGLAIGATGLIIDLTNGGDYEFGNYNHKESNFPKVMMATGGALILFTLPLKIIGKNKIRNSVNLYNESKEKTEPITKISLLNNENGFGLRLAF